VSKKEDRGKRGRKDPKPLDRLEKAVNGAVAQLKPKERRTRLGC